VFLGKYPLPSLNLYGKKNGNPGGGGNSLLSTEQDGCSIFL